MFREKLRSGEQQLNTEGDENAEISTSHKLRLQDEFLKSVHARLERTSPKKVKPGKEFAKPEMIKVSHDTRLTDILLSQNNYAL